VVAVVVSLALASHGCSWLFVEGPPRVAPPPQFPLDCTTSRAAPVIDTIIAAPHALLAVVGVAAMSDADSDSETDGIAHVLGGLIFLYGLSVTLVYGLSAHSGYRDTRRCRELEAQRLRQPVPPAPAPTWGPPGGE
jgi:hypothetical protein